MSKKATRRAARQAFPKAKTPTQTKGIYGTNRQSPKSKGTGGGGRTSARSGVRPPSVKRSVITGAVMAILYFVLIEWAWKSGASVLANAIISLVGLIIFAAVTYGVDKFKYQRYLRKQKQSPK